MNKEIKSLLDDMGAKDEDDLLLKLSNDALTMKCIKCKKERPWEFIRFRGGDPVCKYCA